MDELDSDYYGGAEIELPARVCAILCVPRGCNQYAGIELSISVT